MPEGAWQQTLELPFTAPFDWSIFLGFYRLRAIPGVEAVVGECFRRALRIDDQTVVINLSPGPGDYLRLDIDQALGDGSCARLVDNVNAAFDLHTDPRPITRHLQQSAKLAAAVQSRPGIRVPGVIDPFEQGIRAILGQQISVVAAVRLARRMCERWGERFASPADPTLEYCSPIPERLATADIAELGMPRSRARTINSFASAWLSTPDLLARGGSLDAAIERLCALPGIGPWSAHYIAMRALRHGDAFPGSDIGILRALTPRGGTRPSARAALVIAEAWRPWRAYAAQYLWLMET